MLSIFFCIKNTISDQFPLVCFYCFLIFDSFDSYPWPLWNTSSFYIIYIICNTNMHLLRVYAFFWKPYYVIVVKNVKHFDSLSPIINLPSRDILWEKMRLLTLRLHHRDRKTCWIIYMHIFWAFLIYILPLRHETTDARYIMENE